MFLLLKSVISTAKPRLQVFFYYRITECLIVSSYTSDGVFSDERDLVSLRFWHRSAWQHCVPVLGEEMAVLWQSSQRLTSYLVPCFHLAFLFEMLPWGWVGLLRPTVNGRVVIIGDIFNCKLKLYCRCIPVRFVLTTLPVFVQGLLEMEFALPTDSTEASGLSLLRRLWVARFDIEEEAQELAEKYVASGSLCNNCLFRSIIWIIKIRLILYYPLDCGSLWVWSWSLSFVPCWLETSPTMRRPSDLPVQKLCQLLCPITQTSLPVFSASSLSSTTRNSMWELQDVKSH